MAKPKELMNGREAALFLGINQHTLLHWIRAGDGPPRTRKGKRFYYVRELLREWLRANAPRVTACDDVPRVQPPAVRLRVAASATRLVD